MCIGMIGTLHVFILCSWIPNTLDPTFFTVLTMFWAEGMYTFRESVGGAVTMLQTSSSFSESIGLTAFPREVRDNVIEATFESSFSFGGRPFIVESTIEFVDYNGKRFGVGTVGEQK